MPQLDENVVVGQSGHAAKHREERREVNRLRNRLASLEAGLGVSVRGELADTSALPATGQRAEGYLIQGHLWTWDETSATWVDAGSVQGPQGETGPEGPQGIQGLRGPQGIQGPTGAQGPQGLQGVKGDKGDQGTGLNILGSKATSAELPATGAMGDSWITQNDSHLWTWQTDSSTWLDVGVIPQGPKGDKGDPGPQGPAGAAGAAGPQGPQGVPGPTGATGPQGPAGPAQTDASALTTGTLGVARLPNLEAAGYATKTYADNSATTKAKAEVAPLTALDITRTRGEYVVSLDLADDNVLQAAAKDNVSGTWMAAQTDSSDSILLTRMTADGTQVDSQYLTGAGHGSVISTRTENGAIYVYLSWATAPAAGYSHNFVKVKYTPGQTIDRTSSLITRINDFNTAGRYVLYSVDFHTDYVAVRDLSGTTETWKLRKLAEMVAGVDKVYASFTTQTTGRVFQSFATDGTTLWVYIGTGPLGDARRIEAYSWATGTLVATNDTKSLGLNGDGGVQGDYAEPEGMALYRDPRNPIPQLTFGLTLGYSLRRRYEIYRIGPVNAPSMYLERAHQVERRLESAPDGTARRVHYGFKSLAEIVYPGWWYADTGRMGSFTDRPSDWTSGGYWIHVSPQAGNGSVRQRLIRNSTGSGQEWVRTVNIPTATKSSWYRVGLTAVGDV